LETIAVTRAQASDLHEAARKRAARANKTKGRGGGSTKAAAASYFQRVAGAVPPLTDNSTSCANHILVRAAIGLRRSAGITHKAMGRVHFKRNSRLAGEYPRGVACYMKWDAWNQPLESSAQRNRVIRRRMIDRTKSIIIPAARQYAMGTYEEFKDDENEERAETGRLPVSAEEEPALRREFVEEETRKTLSRYAWTKDNADRFGFRPQDLEVHRFLRRGGRPPPGIVEGMQGMQL
jgi:hypothetical protein